MHPPKAKVARLSWMNHRDQWFELPEFDAWLDQRKESLVDQNVDVDEQNPRHQLFHTTKLLLSPGSKVQTEGFQLEKASV